MRNRFFIIILCSLALSALGNTWLHSYLFRVQRVELIDSQILEVSKILTSSPEIQAAISNPSKLDSKLIDDVISSVLQSRRIGKVFVLRDSLGKILYQNISVSLIGVEIPITPEWVTVESSDVFVRLRNLKIDPGHPLNWQVGLVINRDFIEWDLIDREALYYVFGIVAIVFIASVIVTVLLLSPLRQLISHLKKTAQQQAEARDLESLPAKLLSYPNGFWAKSDEFSSLIENIQALIDRVNLNSKLTRSWTFQMAHELKTPLSVLKAALERNPRENNPEMIQEIQRMSGIISQFLDWAEIENTRIQKSLHALKLKTVVAGISERLSQLYPLRIEIEAFNEISVIAHPLHLENLVLNLIGNALKYSDSNSKVIVKIHRDSLEVRDSGPGIPKKVMERLGEPFNVGADSAGGHGLGLAWVKSVAKLYGWRFELVSGFQGTVARIDFLVHDSAQ